MAEYNNYLAVGEETTRGTAESSTVGFIPVQGDFALPAPDYMARKRDEHRGEDTQKGHTTEIRMGEQWSGLSMQTPFFTEAGSTSGMVGTVLKHFFGSATTAQNGATSQYAHMMYPVPDPFSSSNLDTKALTFNMNAIHGGTVKNHPYTGGRVNKVTFAQEAGQPLLMTVESMGQTLDTPTTAISSPTYAAENLRADYNNLTIREGATVTRTGSAPDYTDLASNGNQISPDSITLEFERGFEDKIILDGTQSPGKTTVGRFTGKLSMTIDFEDPASGFSSVDDFTTWLAGTSSTNFLLTWDTGTQAGTGDNHSLIIDIPVANRLGGMPEIPLDGQPTITLEYDFHYDSSTTLYAMGLLLKNTATAV